MSGNTIGKLFTVTTFGESHGLALGAIIDGCPPGLELRKQTCKRLGSPQARHLTLYHTAPEDDEVKILSGVFEGKTTGTSIGLLIENRDQRSKDYGKIKDRFRPMHADYSYEQNTGCGIIAAVAGRRHEKRQCVWPRALLPKNTWRSSTAFWCAATSRNWGLLERKSWTGIWWKPILSSAPMRIKSGDGSLHAGTA